MRTGRDDRGADFHHEELLVTRAARREVWPLIGDWLESRFA